MKRILLTSDWHCGSAFGLVPPSWQTEEYQPLQAKLWEFWMKVCEEPYDAVILNGDVIDGGIDVQDHVTLDRTGQVKMALEALATLHTEKIFITLGTPKHTGGDGVYETLLDKDERVRFATEHRVQVGEFRIHARHRMGSSRTPYGIESQLMAEALRQVSIDRDWFGIDPPHLVVRSHVHRFAHVKHPKVSALSTPCLQYPFSLFGATQSSWRYEMGVVVLTVSETGEYDAELYLIHLKDSGASQGRYMRI